MNDFLLDINGDMQLPLTRGRSNEQHQEHLLVLEKGEIKESPVSTVGLMQFINADDKQDLVREVALRFSNDKMSVKQVSYNEQTGELNYDATYNN